jgi:hypothetical protein
MAIFKKLSIAAITLLLGVGAQNQGQLCTGETSFNVGFCSLDDTNSCISNDYNAETGTNGSCGGSVLLKSPSWLIARTFAVSQILGVHLHSVPILLESDFVWAVTFSLTRRVCVGRTFNLWRYLWVVRSIHLYRFPSNVLILLQCCIV